MNLYWFCDEDGHFWVVMAAPTEKRAWELFLAKEQSIVGQEETTMEELQEEHEIGAVTGLTAQEGEVAVIFPLEVNFSIRKEPGSKDLGHRSDF